MHPIHDVDALLLLATMHASKRRPAEVVEIMAAADMLQGGIPAEWKLVDGFRRLATHGLLIQVDGCFALTPDAEAMMVGHPRKADADERIFIIKERLAGYDTGKDHPSIKITPEEVSAAIEAHKAAAQGSGRNLLMPKPKVDETNAEPGQRRRRPAGSMRRRD